MEHFTPIIKENGFCIIPHFFSDDHIEQIIKELELYKALQYEEQTTATVNLIQSVPVVHHLAYSQPLNSLMQPILSQPAIPVNAFVIDKSRTHNWGLDWHQDLKIAVQYKKETPGYHSWSMESGIPHTIPPQEILENKLSVRIHLDDCNSDNGALLVIPRSQKKGIIHDPAEMRKAIDAINTCCAIKKGGIMVMSPLLLHKSPFSGSDQKRRVLQIDFAGIALPDGLDWYT